MTFVSHPAAGSAAATEGGSEKKTSAPRVQTNPPTIPMHELYAAGTFPEGQRMLYKDE